MSAITEPGVYAMPADAYHADPCAPASLSSTGARRLISSCPAIYWHERQHGARRTDALDLGSAAHEWVLEGDSWPSRHAVLPEDHNGTTKEGKARVAEIRAAGRVSIKAEAFATIRAMKAALEAHEFAGAAFRAGRPETSMFWRDGEFGTWCRGRLDYLPAQGRIFADYKTCVSAEPEALRRHVLNFGYHQQAAWYTEGICRLGLCDDPIFMLVFQEKTPPHVVTCVVLDDVTLHWGEVLNRKAKGTFASCLRSGSWPGYADDVVTLSLPSWEHDRLRRLDEAGELDPIEPEPRKEAA